MRRYDRQVTLFSEILEIIQRSRVCRLGLISNGLAYIVPLNFGYMIIGEHLNLFFHCASEGKKVDLLKANPQISFEMDCDHNLLPAENACSNGFAYSCVMGSGSVRMLDSIDEKIMALQQIMRQQTGRNWDFQGLDLSNVLVFELSVKTISAKHRSNKE